MWLGSIRAAARSRPSRASWSSSAPGRNQQSDRGPVLAVTGRTETESIISPACSASRSPRPFALSRSSSTAASSARAAASRSAVAELSGQDWVPGTSRWSAAIHSAKKRSTLLAPLSALRGLDCRARGHGVLDRRHAPAHPDCLARGRPPWRNRTARRHDHPNTRRHSRRAGARYSRRIPGMAIRPRRCPFG